jgi:hypothetical protein
MEVLIASDIFDKSLIYIMNKSGPSMDPCGTPFIIVVHLEFNLLLSEPLKMAALCFLFNRYDL